MLLLPFINTSPNDAVRDGWKTDMEGAAASWLATSCGVCSTALHSVLMLMFYLATPMRFGFVNGLLHSEDNMPSGFDVSYATFLKQNSFRGLVSLAVRFCSSGT